MYIEPLIVREKGTKLFLVAGEKCLKAAKSAGLKKVPVMVEENANMGVK